MPRGVLGPWRLASIAWAWLLGTGAQLQLSAPLAPVVTAVALVAALGIGLRCLGSASRMPRLLGIAAVAVLAFALCNLRAQVRLDDALIPELEGRELTLTGVVVGLPRLSALGMQFEFRVESARLGEQRVRVPGRISLGWSSGWDGEALPGPAARPLTAGDRWRIPARLKQPHGFQNPQGFDLELWLFERELRASGSVRPGARFLGSTWAHPIDRLRQHVRDRILLQVGQARAAGVLAALAVGDQAAIDRDDWDVFRITGVAHLMSISGVNVTLDYVWIPQCGTLLTNWSS